MENKIIRKRKYAFNPFIAFQAPRLSRLEYFYSNLSWTAIMFAIFFIIGGFIGYFSQEEMQTQILLNLISGGGVIIASIIFFIISLKRVHDMNFGWPINLLILIPIISIFVGLVFLFKRPSDWENLEGNRFGESRLVKFALKQ